MKTLHITTAICSGLAMLAFGVTFALGVAQAKEFGYCFPWGMLTAYELLFMIDSIHMASHINQKSGGDQDAG